MTLKRKLYGYGILLMIGLSLPLFGAEDQSDETLKPVVYIIPFEGEVETGLLHVLQRGFAEAEEHRSTYIVIEMDTPGGRVDAALDIVDLILESEIPVAIMVTGNATSAGAIITLAADQVFMKQTSTIGTAAPVFIGGGGEQSENMEAKALSYVLAHVRKICDEKGYSEFKTRLAEAMVDKEIEIKEPDNPDQYITKKGSLLTFTAAEAKEYGFITGLVDGRSDVLKRLLLDDAKQVFFKETFFEKVARFFASTTVSGLLLTIAFMALFVELQQPGIGIPGLIALLAFLLFFWGHAIAGLAGWEGPLLLVIGILLISVELFVIPGFGFVGILGFLSVIASVVVTLMDRSITSPHFFETFNWSDLTEALGITVFSILLGICGALAIPTMFPFLARTRAASWLILDQNEERAKGYHSAAEGQDELRGKRGLTKSTLRPSGIAVIDGRRVDVVSQGAYIAPGTEVEVVKVEGQRVVVRAV